MSTAVINAVPNDLLRRRYDNSGRTIASITNGRPSPLADTGGAQLCLSWHLRCSCFAECGRVATHRPLTMTEVTRIAELLTAAGIE